jgi:hypothetical protein
MFEGPGQTSKGEQAVEIFPAIGIERLEQRVALHDGDIVHAGKQGEIHKYIFPNLSVRLVDLWPDGQWRQSPLL